MIGWTIVPRLFNIAIPCVDDRPLNVRLIAKIGRNSNAIDKVITALE